MAKRTKIQSDWPESAWTWAPKGTYANWTSYPTYAYQQFYRMNPDPERQALENRKKKRKKTKARRNTSVPPSQAPVKVIVAGSETDIPQSSFEAKRVPWKYATNAGPFLPQMFPYGQGGRPEVYAFTNPRGRQVREKYLGSGRRGGFVGTERDSLPAWYFLIPSTRSWPAGDPRKGARDDMHAMEVIRYMNRGFGNRSQYPMLIEALAERYPVTDRENMPIWIFYDQVYEGISEKARGEMPTVYDLR